MLSAKARNRGAPLVRIRLAATTKAATVNESDRIVNARCATLPLFIAMLTSPASSYAAAAACAAASGSTVPAVVELYTSEGCDSCPPADRWVSSLKAEAAKGKVIPLAFHVDYWDYIGWKDRFADPAFGARHREAAGRGGASVVYTPQVLVDGREYQQWRRTSGDKFAAASPKPARAELRVAVAPAGTQLRLTLTGRTAQPVHGAQAWIALYENGLSTDVKAGENKGVMLHHDFVVRRWLGPFAFDGSGLNVMQSLVPPAGSVIAQSGIAVVAVDDSGSILQAVTLPLRDCPG